MELKRFQKSVLGTLDIYLDELAAQKQRYDKIRAANALETDTDLIRPLPHYPKDAWDELRRAGALPQSRATIPYSERRDSGGVPVPNVCLKLPTGGGKTLIAVNSIGRILPRFLNTNRGVVLWIVPNDAIYRQTLERLVDRDDPYRQSLDRLAAGRVIVLEKGDRIARADVEENLCILLLMLQSANRQSKETLRLFKDRGDVHGFFPRDDDYEAHRELLSAIPGADVYGDVSGFIAVVKSSLGNVLRMVRPVVIVDEGHKAYSLGAIRTILGFNPSFLLELSATPKDRWREDPPIYSNWLVDVRGRDLLDEELIRLPINLEVKGGADWRDAVRASTQRLQQLQDAADNLRANSGRYLRPILLVQVERTGREQRDTAYIHAEDARQYLLTLGFSPHEIAIKSSQQDDLARYGTAELLEPTCPIRVIITKQALQEGWDCPFAYVLCSLSATRSLASMAQLVGRIIRQSGGSRTLDALLDESYVICHHQRTRDVIAAVKAALEGEGMSDLAEQIKTLDSEGERTATVRSLTRRRSFSMVDITLPVVLKGSTNGTRRPMVYESDILAHIPWHDVDGGHFANDLPLELKPPATLLTRISVAKARKGFSVDPLMLQHEELRFDAAFVTRALNDVLPNPWIARRIIGEAQRGLENRGFTRTQLGGLQSFLIEELRKWVIKRRDDLAKVIFTDSLATGDFIFVPNGGWSLPVQGPNRFPDGTPHLIRENGEALAKSLLVPAFRPEFNDDEAAFASYLDELDAVIWWHRNPVRGGAYYLQGWRPNLVYPDFIFQFQRDDRATTISVIETKGDQLEGNVDTTYKRSLLGLLAQHADAVGRLNLGEADKRIPMTLDVFLMSEWKRRINQTLGG